jgi:hypothetical protein
MDYGLADSAPPVHAIERPEPPPPNPLSGTIKICIDYDSSLLLQRVYSEILSKVEQCTWALLTIRRPVQEPAEVGSLPYKRGEYRTIIIPRRDQHRAR